MCTEHWGAHKGWPSQFGVEDHPKTDNDGGTCFMFSVSLDDRSKSQST